MKVRREPIRPARLAGIGLIVMAAACSSDGDDDAAVVAEAVSTTAPTEGSAATVETTSAPATTAPPPPITEIQLLGSPDWLAVDEGGVWVRGEPGLVIRIDPSTNAVTGEVSVGGEPCQGVGTGAGSIFTCAGTDVVRIDPVSLEVVATYPAGKAFSQGELAVTDHTLWVLTGDGSALLPIDTDTDTLGVPIYLPARGTDLAVGDAGLWIASAVDDSVMQVDPVTGAVLRTLAAPNGPYTLAVDDQVWALGADAMVRIDPVAGVVDLSVPVDGGGDGSVALTPGVVWVHSSDATFIQIDPLDGAVITEPALAAAGGEIAERMTSAGDMVAGFGSIWATANDDARLFRVDVAQTSG